MENNEDKKYNVWQDISMLSQLSISFLTPILMMIFLCLWLKNKFGMGDWFVITGFLLGLGSGISTVAKYLKKRVRQAEEQQQREYKDKYG